MKTNVAINLFSLPAILPANELFEMLVPDNGVLIERIVSCGHTTPAGQWYDQKRDEWVVLLQGSALLSYQDGQTVALGPGDSLLIPARTLHRVEKTSQSPPCIWIAVHGKLLDDA